MSPSMSKAMVRPSGLTLTVDQVVSVVSMATSRHSPGGLLTSHFGSLFASDLPEAAGLPALPAGADVPPGEGLPAAPARMRGKLRVSKARAARRNRVMGRHLPEMKAERYTTSRHLKRLG